MDTIELLWRDELPAAGRRGRPPRFTVDEVVTAAIGVADESGTRFTLREVAGALGVPVMSLYSYIDSREQLLELMIDTCRGAMGWSEPVGDWAAQLRVIADDNLRLFERHPWLADIETERAVLGPGTLAKYERELAAVAELPMPDADRDAALTLVLDYVRSAACSLAHARVERATETPEQWWQREGAKLAELNVAQRFPLADRIGTAAGQARGAATDAAAAYDFGLAMILAGLAARIA